MTSTSTSTMAETADNTSTFRSYASRRSLLDHHIPSSELELGIMNKDKVDISRDAEAPALGPVLGSHSTNTGTNMDGTSASAPVSPIDRSKNSQARTTPLVIPTDHYDGRTPSDRGPPRSALPDFLPPSKPEQVNEYQNDPQGQASSYAQPQLQNSHHHPTSGAGPSGPPKQLLSTYMMDHPNDTVRDAIKERFPLPNPLVRLFKRFRIKHSVIEGMTKEEMDHWEAQREILMQKAGWKMEGTEGPGTEVTELYWKVSGRRSVVLRRYQ